MVVEQERRLSPRTAVRGLGVALIVVAAGCNREPSPTNAPPTPVVIEFDGRSWEQVGPCDVGRQARPGMTATAYKTSDPNVRLVEFALDPKSQPVERLNVRIRRVQVLRDGRWIDDGLKLCNYSDGSRMETRMTLGVFGEQKEWDMHGERVVYRGCADQFFHDDEFTE